MGICMPGGKQYLYGTDDGTISISKANFNVGIHWM